MNQRISEKIRPMDSPPEIATYSIEQALRQVTLADGHTRVYENCHIRLHTLTPPEIAELQSIALYAANNVFGELDQVDQKLRETVGCGINSADKLYVINGQPVGVPVIEVENGKRIIVDGLHRCLRSLKNNETLTVAEIAGVEEKYRLPFVSIPIHEVALVTHIPEKKRILTDQNLSPEQVRSLYRNFGIFGSNHRDESSLFRNSVPWELHQIRRNEDEMKLWTSITKSLKDFAPPLPSMLTKPPLRIMVSPEGHIFNRDNTIRGFGKPGELDYPFASCTFTTIWYSSSDFYRRATPAMGRGEALLVNKEHWQQRCTKLVLLSSNKNFTEIVDPLCLDDKPSVSVPEVSDNYVSSVSVGSSTYAVFEKANISFDSCFDSRGNIILGLAPCTLVGINQHQVLNAYELHWAEKPIETSHKHSGPTLFLSPDVYQLAKLSVSRTSASMSNISQQIVSRLDDTQWFGTTQETPPKFIASPSQAAAYEHKINDSTEWAGQVSPTDFLELLSEGQIVHLPTITAECVGLLQQGTLAVDHDIGESYVTLQKRESPLGDIYVLPELPLECNKSANSMKTPSHKQRMDVSFTLLQTNLEIINKCSSSGELVQMKLSNLLRLLTNSEDRLPFDIESLGHIFSALAISGGLQLAQS